jgi:hypothetical protein
VQDVKVAGRVEFGNTVSLNAAVVQQILRRLRDIESKQSSMAESITNIGVDLTEILRRLAAAEAGLEQLRQETQIFREFVQQNIVVVDSIAPTEPSTEPQ